MSENNEYIEYEKDLREQMVDELMSIHCQRCGGEDYGCIGCIADKKFRGTVEKYVKLRTGD